MDLQKLTNLAKQNPNAAKAFLNRKEKEDLVKAAAKKDRFFTESQLETVITKIVKDQVSRIPKAKDGHTPTKDELRQVIQPMIPLVRDGKDGKDARIRQETIDKMVSAVLARVQSSKDLTQAIVSVFKEERIKVEDLPGYKELKDRVDRLANNQKFVGGGRGIGGGYTDADVRRVIAEDGGLNSLPDQTGNSGKFLTTDGSDASWATLAGGGDMAAATYDPNTVSGDAFLMTNMNGGNWKVFYSNGTGDVTEVALGTANQVLTSNGATSAPTFEDVVATVTALGDVGDVTITTIASGEVLKWNGSAWINNTLAEAGIAAASHTHATSDVTSGTFDDARIAQTNVTQHQAALSITESQISDLGSYITDISGSPLSQLSDVTITTIASGELLKWNGSAWINNTLAEAGIQPVPIEGAFVDGDKTKLNGIETGADVTDATNVDAAGAVMNSDTTTNAMSFVVDEDNMASDSDAKVPTQQSVKAYVDTFVGSSNIATVGTVTSGNVDAVVSAASTTTAGKVELATTTETNTGTDTGRAVTPDGLAGSYAGTKSVGVVRVESDTAVTVADGKEAITIPPSLNGMNLVDVIASVHTQGVTGTTDIQVRRRRSGTDVDMLTTKVTIGAEYYANDGSVNATNDDVQTGDQIYIDVDAIHSGTAPNGLSVTLEFRLP